MSGVLAIQLAGEHHYVAVSGGGSAQLLVDPSGRRSARPNAVAVNAREYWTGNAALASTGAGLASAAASLDEAGLASRGPLLETARWRLSAAACLALLLKKAREEARAHGMPVDRAVVLSDGVVGAPVLAAALGDYLAMPVELVAPASAMHDWMRVGGLGRRSRKLSMAAVFDHRIILAHADAARAPDGRVDEFPGLAQLRTGLFAEAGAGQADAWTRLRLWNAFLAWLAQEADGAAAEPFRPGLIDARLEQVAIGMAWARSRLGLLAHEPLACLGPRMALADLVLLADDEVMHFWRRALATAGGASGALVTVLPPDRLVRHAARRPAPAAARALPELGVRIAGDGGSRAVVRLPPLDGAPPHMVCASVEGGLTGQSVFDIELLASGRDASATVLRRLRFQAALPLLDKPRFLIRVDLSGGQPVNMQVSNERTGERLRLLDSHVPCDGQQWLSGPEAVATLVAAGT